MQILLPPTHKSAPWLVSPSPSGWPVAAASSCSDSAHSPCRLHRRSQGPCKNKGVSVTHPHGTPSKDCHLISNDIKTSLTTHKAQVIWPSACDLTYAPLLAGPAQGQSPAVPKHTCVLPQACAPALSSRRRVPLRPRRLGVEGTSPIHRQPPGAPTPSGQNLRCPGSWAHILVRPFLVTCFHLPSMPSAPLSLAITYGT